MRSLTERRGNEGLWGRLGGARGQARGSRRAGTRRGRRAAAVFGAAAPPRAKRVAHSSLSGAREPARRSPRPAVAKQPPAATHSRHAPAWLDTPRAPAAGPAAAKLQAWKGGGGRGVGRGGGRARRARRPPSPRAHLGPGLARGAPWRMSAATPRAWRDIGGAVWAQRVKRAHRDGCSLFSPHPGHAPAAAFSQWRPRPRAAGLRAKWPSCLPPPPASASASRSASPRKARASSCRAGDR